MPRVLVLAATEADAAAARAALRAAGLDSASAVVQSEPIDAEGRAYRGPVLCVAESLAQLDAGELTESGERDFLLRRNVADELAERIRLLQERSTRRAERRASAESLRWRAMELSWSLHSESTAGELARKLVTGLCRVFEASAAAVAIPADRHAGSEADASAWLSRGEGVPIPASALDSGAAPLLSRLRRRADARALPSLSPTGGASVVELSRPADEALLTEVFGPEVRRAYAVPIDLDDELLGELMIADADSPARRTSFERLLMAFFGAQVGRALTELRLRDREQETQRRLHETSAELQRLVDEMDDFGVVIRSIADAVNVGVLFYDNDNQPKLHNRMVEKLLALTGFDEASGRSSHVYASDRRTRVKQGLNIISETLEGDQRGLIYWIGDPEGEQRAVVTEAHTITRPGGQRLGTAVVAYDVTDLANAIEIREEYLATVSHELRTPLTSIVGYLDLIDDGYEVDKLGFGKEFRTLQRSAEQMLALIRDLLSTSTRELTLRVEPTDVTALLAQSMSTLRPTAEASHQELRLESPAGTVIAHLDPARIRQVVDNLISNAVKYTPDGGTITLALAREEESVIISVTDNGRGIGKSDQARLFDRFFRARDAREAAIQGVGIGLTIVHTIVEAHGGTVTVDSEPGRGSTFTVRLPVRSESTPLPTLPLKP